MPWRGSTDPNPFQVMLAVPRAAACFNIQSKSQPASRNSQSAHSTLSHWNGNGLSSSLTRPVLSFEKPRRRIKWGPGMHLGIILEGGPQSSSQQQSVRIRTQKPSQGRGTAVDWFSTSPPAAPGWMSHDAIRHQTKGPRRSSIELVMLMQACLLWLAVCMRACVRACVRPYCKVRSSR